jgi:hydroxylysine kinase
MGDVLQPGVIIKPQMDKLMAQDLARKLYGLEPISCVEFNSYDDRNYFMVMEANTSNPNIKQVHSAGYVLKVTNSQDSKDPDFTDAQNLMILHMAEELPVPVPVKNKDDNYKSIQDINGTRHIVRLLKYIAGKILYDIPDWTTKHFYQCGELAARLDSTLSTFDHPAYQSRSSIWFLSSVPHLTKFTIAVKDATNKALAENIIEHFCKQVKPLESTLPSGIIHGDLNEQNILVQKDANSDDYAVYSVLDFGDSQRSCYVYELAITIMYMMTQCRCIPAYEAGGHVLAGYTKHRSLNDDERKLLRLCVAARYAQSLVMGAYSYEQDPGNEYLLITSKNGWKILHEFWNIPAEELYRKWASIMEEYDQSKKNYLPC